VKRYLEIGSEEVLGSVGRANRTIVWHGAGLQQTVGWLLGPPVMTFRPATCVDGDLALGLRQWCCVGVGSPVVWVVLMFGLRGFLILFRKYIFFNLNLV
jgi:hypothetical protein